MVAARVLPQPPAAALAGWLPSRGHPSDHLAVVADLEWLPGGAAAGARPQRAEDEGDGEPESAGPHGGGAAPRGADGPGAGRARAAAPGASHSQSPAGSGGAGVSRCGRSCGRCYEDLLRGTRPPYLSKSLAA